MLKIVDRYLLDQLVLIVFFCLLLFSLIWLAPEVLFKLIQTVAAGSVPLTEALRIFVLHIPAVIEQTMPIATLMGTLFLFRRLSLNSELVAILSSGVSIRRLLWPVVMVGLLFTGIQLTVQEFIIPRTGPLLSQLNLAYKLENERDRNFTFVEKNKAGEMDKFFMIGNTAFGQLSDFLILYFQQNPNGGVYVSRILVAPKGRWDETDRVWKLSQGASYELNDEGVYRDVQRFSEQWVATSQYPKKLLSYSQYKPEDMDWGTLSTYIDLLKNGGQLQYIRAYDVRIWQKLFFPLASLLFAIMGALLGIERARASKGQGLTLAAVMVFLYSVMVPFFSNLGNMGIVPAVIAACLPLLLTTVAMSVLIRIRQAEG